MSHFDFSIENIIIKAWSKFRENSFFWILVTLFIVALSLSGNIMPLAGLFTLLSYYFSAAITLISIRYMRNEVISFNDLLAVSSMKFLHYLATSIIVSAFTLLGLVLFIIPGFYIMVRLMFAQYLIIDNNIGFDEAIKKSWYLTKGREFALIGFLSAMFVIVIIGILSFFVGLLISIPVIQLSTAYLYLSLIRNSDKLDVW